MKPKFQHDCKSCKFLGTTTYEDRHYDLYCCVDLTNPNMTDVIARFDSQGSSYISTTVSIISYSEAYAADHPIRKAWELAVENRLALDDESLNRLKTNQILTEDMLHASRFIEAASTLIHSTFISSPASISIALRNINSSVRAYEDDERELVNAIIKFLEKKQKELSKP